MKRSSTNKKLIVSTVFLAGGCGAVPDVVIETARARAIQALENVVGNAVDGVINDTVGELIDLEDIDLPFDDQSHEEGEEEAFDDDTAEPDESNRETRRGFSVSSPLP